MRVRMGIAGKSECGCGRREMNVLLKAHKEAAAERLARAPCACAWGSWAKASAAAADT